MPQFSAKIFLPALCILALGCAKAPPRSALDAARSAGLQTELETLSRAQSQVDTFTGFAQVKLSGGGRHELFDIAVLARAPDRLFFQILDDLGQERVRFVADGGRVLFYDAQENRYERVPQDEAALQEMLKLPLGVTELIDRLLRRLPSFQVLQWEENAGATSPQVTYWAKRTGDLLGLTRSPLTLTYYEGRNAAGKWNYRVEYRSDEMDWSFRRPKVRLSMKFQEIEFGKNLPESRFDTTPPPGSLPRP